MSFRAFVLVGVVALVTAFYQSTQRPVALTVTTGLTSRASVLNRARSSLFGPLFRAFHLLATPSWRVAVLVPVPLPSGHNRSFSNGAAEVATKPVSSWSSALDGPGLFDIDAPNDDQCGLLDVGAPSYDHREPFAPNDNQCAPDDNQRAPDDNQCAPDETVVASPASFELTDPVCTDISRLCPEPLP